MKKILFFLSITLTLFLIGFGFTYTGQEKYTYLLDFFLRRLPPHEDKIAEVAATGQVWKFDTTNVTEYNPAASDMINLFKKDKKYHLYKHECFVLPPRIFFLIESQSYNRFYETWISYYVHNFKEIDSVTRTYDAIFYGRLNGIFFRKEEKITLSNVNDTLHFITYRNVSSLYNKTDKRIPYLEKFVRQE